MLTDHDVTRHNLACTRSRNWAAQNCDIDPQEAGAITFPPRYGRVLAVVGRIGDGSILMLVSMKHRDLAVKGLASIAFVSNAKCIDQKFNNFPVRICSLATPLGCQSCSTWASNAN